MESWSTWDLVVTIGKFTSNFIVTNSGSSLSPSFILIGGSWVRWVWRLFVISINTQVIIQNRALWLVRYLGLSADNHLDEQNGCQSFARFWWNKFFRVVQCFSFLFWNNHLCIYTKTIIRLRLSDSRWIFTSTSSRWIFTENHFAFGE